MSHPSAAAVSCEVLLVLTVNSAEVRGEEITAELERVFAAEVDRTAATKVIVDLRAVNFITSSGIRSLLGLYQKVKAAGGRVVRCGLSDMVAEVLEVMRFIDPTGRRPSPFEVRPDVAAAAVSLLARPAAQAAS